MAKSHWANTFFLKLPRPTLLAGALLALALVALACASPEDPTATSAPAAVVEEEEAMEEEVAAVEEPVAAVEAPGKGTYVERAGLKIFLPEGYEFGGPIIPPDPRDPQYGGTIVSAMNGDPPSLDPYQTTHPIMYIPRAGVNERLIHTPIEAGTDPSISVYVPGLAESWEISNDWLKYTFHLQKGVKWHNLPPVNGREFDAEDVKFTWDLFKSEESIQKGFFVNVDRVEVLDKYTVVIQVDPIIRTAVRLK